MNTLTIPSDEAGHRRDGLGEGAALEKQSLLHTVCVEDKADNAQTLAKIRARLASGRP